MGPQFMSDGQTHAYDANLGAGSDLQGFFEDSSLAVATQFFRNEKLFRQLEEVAIPWLLKKGLLRRKVLQIWSAGCSDGREAYSLAMAARRTLDSHGHFRTRVAVRGSDVSRPQIDIASKGEYQLKAEDKRVLDSYAEFFDRLRPEEWRVKDSLRQSTEFVVEDIARAEHEIQYDILICSLVLLYYDAVYQKTIVEHLITMLRPDGFLFIAPANRRWMKTLNFYPVHDGGPFYYRGRLTKPAAASV